MRKIDRGHSEKLPPVKLYLDELEEIASLLNESCESVYIETGGFQLEELGEITKLKEDVLYDILLWADHSFLRVDLGPDGNRLSIEQDTPRARGLFEHVKAILLRRGRKLGAIKLLLFAAGGAIAATGIALLLVMRPDELEKQFAYFSVGGLIFCAVGTSIGYALGWLTQRFVRYCVVIPRRHIEAPGFFKRNSDTIIVVLITALISSIATYVVTLLTK